MNMIVKEKFKKNLRLGFGRVMPHLIKMREEFIEEIADSMIEKNGYIEKQIEIINNDIFAQTILPINNLLENINYSNCQCNSIKGLLD